MRYENELPILEANDIDKVLSFVTNCPNGDSIPDFEMLMDSTLEFSSDNEMSNILEGTEVLLQILPQTSMVVVQSEESYGSEVLNLDLGTISLTTATNANEIGSILAAKTSNSEAFMEEEEEKDDEDEDLAEYVRKDKKCRDKISSELTLLKEVLHLPNKTTNEKTLKRARHMIATDTSETVAQAFEVSARKDKRCRDKINAEFTEIKNQLQLPEKTTKANVLRCIRCRLESLSRTPVDLE